MVKKAKKLSTKKAPRQAKKTSKARNATGKACSNCRRPGHNILTCKVKKA